MWIMAENDHEIALECALRSALDRKPIRDLLEDADQPPLQDPAGDDVEVDRIETFEEAMVLTRDRGLVIHLSDGSVFDVVVGRRANPRGGR
jgi:hypothetical protein